MKTKLEKTFTLENISVVLIALAILGNGILIGWVIPERIPEGYNERYLYVEINIEETLGYGVAITGNRIEDFVITNSIQDYGYIEGNNTFYCVLNETLTEELENISVQLYVFAGNFIQYVGSHVFHSSVELYEISENCFIAEITFWEIIIY